MSGIKLALIIMLAWQAIAWVAFDTSQSKPSHRLAAAGYMGTMITLAVLV